MQINQELRLAWRRLFRHLDPVLMGLIAALLTLSTLTVASATSGAYLQGHLINMTVALAGMVLLSHLPPQRLIRFAAPLYVVGVLLLVGVAVAGDVVNGSRRWLHIGITRIQPSELMRLAVPMAMAAYLHYRHEALTTRHFALAFLILILPALLILRQPDLGTTLLIMASGFYVLFLAGLAWRVMAGLVLVMGAALPLAWNFVLHDYQKQRVLTLFDPGSDPLGAGYHIIQSTIAIGSGGFFGRGWGEGTQARLDFLPEGHTDFIFAVYSEEFGLLGNCVLLAIYAAIVLRGLSLSYNASGPFGRLLCGAITLTFFTYAFVNMGMVSGILPVVGVPLPLVSYGGTSMVTVLLGFGILMSVASNKSLVKT
ncbi:MAG: rod shape-determining protein RodA [Betaproteobacteria bacterium]|nr:MAG: rod shape-determining protein RodA [Betaproteobacteria bacterium]